MSLRTEPRALGSAWWGRVRRSSATLASVYLSEKPEARTRRAPSGRAAWGWSPTLTSPGRRTPLLSRAAPACSTPASHRGGRLRGPGPGSLCRRLLPTPGGPDPPTGSLPPTPGVEKLKRGPPGLTQSGRPPPARGGLDTGPAVLGLGPGAAVATHSWGPQMRLSPRSAQLGVTCTWRAHRISLRTRPTTRERNT